MTDELCDQFALFEPPVVRAALHSFRRSSSRINLVDTKQILPQRRLGAVMFEEMLDRGYIEQAGHRHQLTTAGREISERPLLPEMSRQRAERDLRIVLEAVQQSNDGDYAVDDIEEVWVSGDYLSGSGAVHQIELHLKLKRRAQYLDPLIAEQHALDVTKRIKARVPRAIGPSQLVDWLAEMLVFGERRPGLFKEATFNLHQIRQSGEPCRRLYARQIGLVRDPVLDHHPDSRPRINTTSLSGNITELRPMDGTWPGAYRSWGRVSPYGLYRGFSPEALALFSHIPEGLRVIGAEPGYTRLPWEPEEFLSGLDGRERMGIMAHGVVSGLGCILRRSMTRDDSGSTLNCVVEKAMGRNAPAQIDIHARSVAAVVALIAAADAERMVRRSIDDAQMQPVRVDLSAAGGESVAEYVAALAKRHLVERQVHVEPVGWSGPMVAILGPEMPVISAPKSAQPTPEQDEWLNTPIDLDF